MLSHIVIETIRIFYKTAQHLWLYTLRTFRIFTNYKASRPTASQTAYLHIF